MKKLLTMPFYLFFVVLSVCSNEANIVTQLQDIKNFSKISDHLASSGMPSENELSTIKKSGYKHVISLLPGDQNEERHQISAIKLTFDQIPVAWGSPKIEDFEEFVSLMDKYGKDKVLVHCAMNYRASAFSYLYQVIKHPESQGDAEKKLQTIWQPHGVWLDFISRVKKRYESKN